MFFSILISLRLFELKYNAGTVKINVMYFGVDTISALFMRHQSKTVDRYTRIFLFSPISNSVFERI